MHSQEHIGTAYQGNERVIVKNTDKQVKGGNVNIATNGDGPQRSNSIIVAYFLIGICMTGVTFSLFLFGFLEWQMVSQEEHLIKMIKELELRVP